MQNSSKLQHLTDDQLKEYSKLYKRSKRFENRKINNCDTKFLYHVVRLIGECEQILATGDLDLQKDHERLKAIRRGESSLEEVESYFQQKEKSLEQLYNDSKLQYSPDEAAIKELLLNCLEEHYGSLSDAIINPDQAVNALKEIQAVLDKNSKLL